MREFVLNWAIDSKQSELRSQILQDSSCRLNTLEPFEKFDPDFTLNYTERHSSFISRNLQVEVTGREIIKHDNRAASAGRYVWEENVINHNIKFLPDMFTITPTRSGNTKAKISTSRWPKIKPRIISNTLD